MQPSYARDGGRTNAEKTRQLIGGTVDIDAHLAAVEVARHMVELHPDLRGLAVHRLAGLEQKGHAVPPGVVDEHRHRRKCGADAARREREIYIYLIFALIIIIFFLFHSNRFSLDFYYVLHFIHATYSTLSCSWTD